jgi:hypothetical protein
VRLCLFSFSFFVVLVNGSKNIILCQYSILLIQKINPLLRLHHCLKHIVTHLVYNQNHHPTTAVKPARLAISRIGVHLLRRSITRLSLSFLVNYICFFFNKYKINRELRCYRLLPYCYYCYHLDTVCYLCFHLLPGYFSLNSE